jgi:hypothetical protein
METEPISDYERERGKPRPDVRHSLVQTNLLVRFGALRPQFTTFSELTLVLDGHRLVPDLSIYGPMTIDLVHDEPYLKEPPLLSILIRTTGQPVQELEETATKLIDAGVQSCWLVQPPLRTVTIFPGHMDGTTVSDGLLTDPVLEIDVDVQDVFDPDT